MSNTETYDESYKDQKYFVSHTKYNCPFCNRRHVSYQVVDKFFFNWSRDSQIFGYIIRCDSCGKRSLHLSQYSWDTNYNPAFVCHPDNMDGDEKPLYDVEKLDSYFFYKKPTSFFVIDNRIPKIIRELLSEAEGCRDINYMTGASGALRKAVYKFLKHQKLTSETYEDKIKELKSKYSRIPEEYIDALSNIQGMTSTNLHEDFDFNPWTSDEFTFLISAFKELMVEIYVRPEERSKVLERVLALNPFNRERVPSDK